jgi:hypothetical protein
MATLKKNSKSSVKDPIFGNAAKIGFLHKLLSRVSKLLVSTVYHELQHHTTAVVATICAFSAHPQMTSTNKNR